MTAFASFVLPAVLIAASPARAQQSRVPVHSNGGRTSGTVYQIKEGFVYVHGLFLYYTELGQDEPLIAFARRAWRIL